MDAPNKIFVAEAMGTENGLFGLWTDRDHRDTPYIEYISKPALLELLKGARKHIDDSDADDIRKVVAFCVMDPIIKAIEQL